MFNGILFQQILLVIDGVSTVTKDCENIGYFKGQL